MEQARAAQALHAFLEAGVSAPEEYVASKFETHDVVFLGEQHLVRQNLEFLARLLPRLYSAGVTILGYEFAKSDDQNVIDDLTTAPEYREELANDVLLNWLPRWGFREYREIFRVAWEINQGIGPNDEPFRIVALNGNEESEDLDDDSESTVETHRNRALGGAFYNMINLHWAAVIDREVIQPRRKALIYAGAGHTYTKSFFDTGSGRPSGSEGLSAGNFIYHYIEQRACRISLHGSEFREELATGAIDDAVRMLAAERRHGGFDVAGSPAGELPVTQPGYVWLEGRLPSVLADVTDGYVFVGALEELEPVSLIEVFVAAARVEDTYRRVGGTATHGRIHEELDRYRHASFENEARSVFSSAKGYRVPRFEAGDD